jgi:hypothetical protein
LTTVIPVFQDGNRVQIWTTKDQLLSIFTC